MANSDVKRLADLIEASGLSVRRFAMDVMSRDERTIRRWLKREIEIPDAAADWLRRVVSVRVRADGTVVITVTPPSEAL